MKRHSLFALAALLVLGGFSTSCNKEKSWSTEVLGFESKTHNEIQLLVDFRLPRNDNYVYGGVCYGFEENPTFADGYKDKQYLNSEEDIIYLTDLWSNQEYHIRPFITPNGGGETIYGSDYVISTDALPEAPCAPTAGLCNFGGSNFVMDDLTVTNTSGSTYEMNATCSNGDITFQFHYDPKSSVYYTNSSSVGTDPLEVIITADLGPGFGCDYTGQCNEVYVDTDGTGSYSISFCDLSLYTFTFGCLDLTGCYGEIHN